MSGKRPQKRSNSLPEFEQRLVERLLNRFYDRRLLAHVQHQIRLHHMIRGNSITLLEIRPGFDKSAIWVKSPVARFQFDPATGLWSLYWHDRNRRWRRYEDAAPTRNLESLISEVDRDPTSIFWG
ncbi:MAG TPA: DUF3024 domain-containing protein [Burkholderiales bacterium]|nr:DUF3024 domain-containing protein [Burkholderiales bacterium]